MNFKEIKELIKIIDSSSLSEFHFEQGEIKVTLKKEITVKQVGYMDKIECTAADIREDGVPVTREVPDKIEENLHIIKSPIVGVYYSAPSPDLPAFVKAGDKVENGQVLCIIEAMKLMNEISSDVDGEIIEVLVQNQSPVEFGQPLFKIRKV